MNLARSESSPEDLKYYASVALGNFDRKVVSIIDLREFKI
jgi:hypothetical protein